MNGRPLTTCLLLLIMAMDAPELSAATSSDNFDKSITIIEVATQEPDFDNPWRGKQIDTTNHLGVVLSPKHILVTAFAVTHQTSIQVRLRGSANPVPAVIDLVDNNANLAILVPATGIDFGDVKPIKIGSDLAIGKTAELYSGRNKSRFISSPVRLHDIEVKEVLTSDYQYAHYLFQVHETKGLGWSEPVFNKARELLAITSGQDEDNLYAIPAKIIKHFWLDYQQNRPYLGFTSLGISIGHLNTPQIRAFIGVSRAQPGVMVTRVAKTSPFFGKLQQYDVITAIANHPIIGSGLYNHPAWGKISFIDIIADFHSGDQISMTVLRANKPLNITARGKPHNQNDALVPGFVTGPIPHLIFNGFLFQELSLGFLKTWGNSWLGRAPEPMVYIYKYRNNNDYEGRKRVIVLNRVLADPQNRGYQSLKNSILRSVNGIEIESMDDLRTALKNPTSIQDGHARFVFAYADGEVILHYTGLKAAHERIAENFNIKHGESFFELPKTP